MNLSNTIFYSFLIAFGLCISPRAECQSTASSLHRLMKKKSFKRLRGSDIKMLSHAYNMKGLVRAMKRADYILTTFPTLQLDATALLQTTLFIECKLPSYIKQKKYYLDKKATGLAHTVEYDPSIKATFIVLTGKAAYLGSGKKKTVKKAIFYSAQHPCIVARAEQSQPMDTELAMMKLLQNTPGLFTTVGFGKHTEENTNYTTVYSKLYHPGSLKDANYQDYTFTIHEKMQIALHILQGLNTLHRRGIVHRDLGDGNYLIDISEGSPGNRTISACIADFGRTDFAKNIAGEIAQARTSYTAPEGLDCRAMTAKDYFATDIFAVGCVFYQLFYEKRAPWQDGSYVKDTTTPLEIRRSALTSRINETVGSRRDYLAKKAYTKALSQKEEFEHLILQMVHTEAKKRGTAAGLHRQMNAIFMRAHDKNETDASMQVKVPAQDITLPVKAPVKAAQWAPPR